MSGLCRVGILGVCGLTRVIRMHVSVSDTGPPSDACLRCIRRFKELPAVVVQPYAHEMSKQK